MPAFGSLKQEEEFETSMGYTERPCLKNRKYYSIAKVNK
jgi:hypothetical protein